MSTKGSSRGRNPSTTSSSDAVGSKSRRPPQVMRPSNQVTDSRRRPYFPKESNVENKKTGLRKAQALKTTKTRLTPMEMKVEMKNLQTELQCRNEDIKYLISFKEMYLREKEKTKEQSEEIKDLKNGIIKLEQHAENMILEARREEDEIQELEKRIDIYRKKLQSLHIDPVTLDELYTSEDEAELERKKQAIRLEAEASIDMMDDHIETAECNIEMINEMNEWILAAIE